VSPRAKGGTYTIAGGQVNAALERVDEKCEAVFRPATRSNPIESITSYDFGLNRSKIIMI